MSTIEYEKVMKQYNEFRKTHPIAETNSPQDKPAQYMQVQEKEKITPQARKVAPKNKIKYDLTGERSTKWKVDPLKIGAIQA